MLQGRYGLAADQVEALRCGFANASVVDVAARGERGLVLGDAGSGHKFRVVTQVQYRIYDVPDEDVWAWARFEFRGTT